MNKTDITNKLTFEELKEKEWKKAVIVFTEDSFDKEYSEKSRSYEVSKENNYFDTGKISKSLFGNCLDGSDAGVRLDIYMFAVPEDGVGKAWKVEYCYIVE